MDQDAKASEFDWKTAVMLPEFISKAPVLSIEDRIRIVDQATVLLRDYYVHLPFKIEIHKIDPLGDLAALRLRASSELIERDFHDQICDIFAQLRDLHTQYSLPTYYKGQAALLPFKLGMFVERGSRRYVVTKRLASYPWRPEDCHFDLGAEILTWCGEPISAVVERAALRSGAAGEEGREARALAALTVSVMDRQPPPAQAVVHITYRADGHAHAASFPYAVLAAPIEEIPAAWQRLVSVDHEGETRRHASKHAYRAPAVAAEQQARRGEMAQPYPDSGALPTLFPTVLEARPIRNENYGYLRIHSFRPEIDAPTIEELTARFLDECERLMAMLPKQGLVLDVRGNGGGYLPLAESMLQLLTPSPITPQSLQLLATPAVLGLAVPSDELSAYVPSLVQALESGGRYSAAFTITRPEWCNDRGQAYHGPVVLVTDARCYSATDAFAAGFQDHAIGPVLGVASATGAGGANVWTLPEFPSLEGLNRDLPGGASFRVALRRTRRVTPREGHLVEEIGVQSDHRHIMTRADLLHDDRDLFARAISLLAEREWYQLDAVATDGALALTARGIETVRVTWGGMIWSQDLAPDAAAATYSVALPPFQGPKLTIQGFKGGKLVASRRLAVSGG